MTRRYHANNVSTTLLTDILSSSTSLTVTSATGFPTIAASEEFRITISQSGFIEIVTVTAVAGSVFTITRAQESTTARAFTAGAVIDLRATANSLDRKADMVSTTGDVVNLSASTLTLGTPASLTLTNATGLPSASLVAVTTNSSAAVGVVGQVVTSTVSAVAITSGTLTNVTSISLPAGDWDVFGSVQAQAAGTTTTLYTSGGISTTSATLPAAGLQTVAPAGAAGLLVGGPVPSQRLSLASTTTVYLVAQISYAVSTCTVAGSITARRER
jgi:hypothetical protein